MPRAQSSPTEPAGSGVALGVGHLQLGVAHRPAAGAGAHLGGGRRGDDRAGLGQAVGFGIADLPVAPEDLDQLLGHRRRGAEDGAEARQVADGRPSATWSCS